ncbi:MAG: DMT family transporter [Cyanobacteria bacterium J06600_6]
MTKNSFLTAKLTSNADSNSAKSGILADGFSLLILAIAIIALAFSPIFTKLSEIELSPTVTIFNRLWIATIIISVWQLISTWRSPSDIPLENIAAANSLSGYKEKGLLILASFSATASAVLWAISFTQTSIASSTVLRSLTPLFISAGAWLILKQRFDRQFMIGMILAIVGGITIGWDDLQLGGDRLLGDGIALLSAALHGANILVVGYLRDRGCATDRVLLWRCGGGALMVLPIVYLTDIQLFPSSAQGWLFVIALAVVCQTFGQSLLVFSLKHFSSSFVGIFALLKPLITALLAWIIFAEGVSLVSGLALILILAGIYLAKTSSSATQN